MFQASEHDVTPKIYSVYILASSTRRLYIGLTSNLPRRLLQHRRDVRPHFTRRYNIDRLVHVEATVHADVALCREKQLKGWTRHKKIALIDEFNPEWRDLSAAWPIPDSRTHVATLSADPSLRSG